MVSVDIFHGLSGHCPRSNNPAGQRPPSPMDVLQTGILENEYSRLVCGFYRHHALPWN